MADRPIIFSGPMVRALLAGQKTQTRRVIKKKPALDAISVFGPKFLLLAGNVDLVGYAPGDRLWVRETAAYINNSQFDEPSYWEYRADTNGRDLPGDWPPEFKDDPERPRWKPAIHMPRAASRLTLLVTGVKVERLQDISRDDAIAEGATSRPNCNGFRQLSTGWSMDWSEVGKFSRFADGGPGPLLEQDISHGDPRFAFGGFINLLHGGERWNCNGSIPLWDQNPFVVAISFDVIKAHIDAMSHLPAQPASPQEADRG